MKVSELMTENVITVTPEDMADKVFVLFHFESIRHLPVVTEKGDLVGVISDRDIKKILGPRRETRVIKDGTEMTVSTRKVRTMMRRKPVTIEPDDTVKKAASIMIRKKIGALPVIHDDKLVGIITATDILRAFVDLSDKVETFRYSLDD